MNGYIKNKTPFWRHAMKRSVAPGQKIPLDELFEQYGKKYDIQPGKPFVDWLVNVKLTKMADMWELVYKGDDTPPVVEAEILEDNVVDAPVNTEAPLEAAPVVESQPEAPEAKVESEEVLKKPKRRPRRNEALQAEMQATGGEVRPFVKKPLEINDVLNMSVRTARVELAKITDINLLKYALQQARQLAGKDSLCRELKRRLNQLELTRR